MEERAAVLLDVQSCPPSNYSVNKLPLNPWALCLSTLLHMIASLTLTTKSII